MGADVFRGEPTRPEFKTGQWFMAKDTEESFGTGDFVIMSDGLGALRGKRLITAVDHATGTLTIEERAFDGVTEWMDAARRARRTQGYTGDLTEYGRALLAFSARRDPTDGEMKRVALAAIPVRFSTSTMLDRETFNRLHSDAMLGFCGAVDAALWHVFVKRQGLLRLMRKRRASLSEKSRELFGDVARIEAP